MNSHRNVGAGHHFQCGGYKIEGVVGGRQILCVYWNLQLFYTTTYHHDSHYILIIGEPFHLASIH